MSSQPCGIEGSLLSIYLRVQINFTFENKNTVKIQIKSPKFSKNYFRSKLDTSLNKILIPKSSVKNIP